MGDSATNLPPLPDEDPKIDFDEPAAPIVKHADIAITGHPRRHSNETQKKKYSLTMFPQRIENASHTSLVLILLAIFGFAIGVGTMILMLQ